MTLIATGNYTTCTYNLSSKYYMTVATVVKKWIFAFMLFVGVLQLL